MRKMMKLCCLLLFLVVVMAGCEKKKANDPVEEGSIKVYKINSSQDGISYINYKTETTKSDQLIDELLQQMSADPESYTTKRAINDDVIVKEISVVDECLKINFDLAYQNQGNITEALMRAAIVKTLCQVDGVSYVEFYVNGVPWTDSNDKAYGQMMAEDFIDDQDVNTNYIPTSLTLYFATDKGNKLIECTEKKGYDGSNTMEQLIILRLIEGPDELEQKEGMRAAIPANTVLNNVTTKEGVCYVDFSKEFLNQMEGIKAEVTLYSVVNSLIELSSINKVQIMIDGKIVDSSLDNVPLNKVYDRNLDLVKGTK